jgi:hypothetical protein
MFRFRIVFLILFISCIGKILTAQEFKVKASLDAVTSTGFYHIPVQPELTAFIKADFSDLRIMDQDNLQIPFIIKAGVYVQERQTSGPNFITNPPLAFVQKDSSNHTSYIEIRQKEAHHVDKVVLSIKGPKYYKRVANLYYWTEKGRKVHLVQFEISSGQIPIISVDRLKEQSMQIEIENQDNPPLVVQAVKTEQISKGLIAYLEKGKSYFIAAGNESLAAPKYDLIQFRDSIPAQVNSLSYHHLQMKGVAVAGKNKMVMSYWLWPAIILFLFILGFLTYQLLADMKRSGI